MRAAAVALLVEEQRGEILARWRRDVDRELGGEPALAFAAGPLLREMALALRGDAAPLQRGAAPAEPGARSAVLVKSGAASGRIAREFKLLHRALWGAVKSAGACVGADERRAGDEWLDEALAAALDRHDRVRARAELLDPGAAPEAPPAGRRAPPPEPARAALGSTPPPLPRRVPPPALAPVIAARPPPLPRPASPPPPVLESGFSAVE